MAKMKIVDLLYNQKKEVELGEVTGTDPIPVETPVEFGSDIEVDGKVKLNSAQDLTDKEGNPLPLGGGGTKLYRHIIHDELSLNVLTLITTSPEPLTDFFYITLDWIIAKGTKDGADYNTVLTTNIVGSPDEPMIVVKVIDTQGELKSISIVNPSDIVREV